MRVFVLLFNVGTDNEGIYAAKDQLSDRNKVLMFESEDDATRYALLLEAQDFPTPTVEEMDSEDIEDFCLSAGYEWDYIQTGKLAIPPENNVENTDWNPEVKPEEIESETGMSKADLERIRRQLEGLL